MKRIAAAMILLAASLAAGAAVVWDEAADGDLATDGTDVGALVLGANIFRGTFSLARTDGGATTADVDVMLFQLDAGRQLATVDARITGTRGYGVFGYQRPVQLATWPELSIVFYEDMADGTTFIDSLPSTRAGDYLLSVGGGGASIDDNVEFFWDWEVRVNVRPIPEPSSVWLLLAAGFIGIWIRHAPPRALLLRA